MSDVQTTKFQKLSAEAAKKSSKSKSDHNVNQGGQAIALLSLFTAAAGGVIGAIAMPMLYATNFGVGVTLAITGAFLGAIAGGVLPSAIHKVTSGKAIQYLKPSTYKEAFKKS